MVNREENFNSVAAVANSATTEMTAVVAAASSRKKDIDPRYQYKV
jgi:hypothetical protein